MQQRPRGRDSPQAPIEALGLNKLCIPAPVVLARFPSRKGGTVRRKKKSTNNSTNSRQPAPIKTESHSLIDYLDAQIIALGSSCPSFKGQVSKFQGFKVEKLQSRPPCAG